MAASLSAPTVPARPAASVVRAGELSRWLCGDAALERATAEAEAIVAAAAAGYEAERQRGYAEGRAVAETELARALATAHATLDSALAEMEAALPALVSSIIEDMLGALDTRALLQPALRRALGQVRRGTEAVLRVAPASLEAAREVLDALGMTQAIRLEADPALQPDRCVFESSLGKAELGVAAQLRVLRETLAARWDSPA